MIFSTDFFVSWQACTITMYKHNYHLISFLPVSLYDELIAWHTTGDLTVEKYSMDNSNFKNAPITLGQSSVKTNVLWIINNRIKNQNQLFEASKNMPHVLIFAL